MLGKLYRVLIFSFGDEKNWVRWAVLCFGARKLEIPLPHSWSGIPESLFSPNNSHSYLQNENMKGWSPKCSVFFFLGVLAFQWDRDKYSIWWKLLRGIRSGSLNIFTLKRNFSFKAPEASEPRRWYPSKTPWTNLKTAGLRELSRAAWNGSSFRLRLKLIYSVFKNSTNTELTLTVRPASGHGEEKGINHQHHSFPNHFHKSLLQNKWFYHLDNEMHSHVFQN